MGLQRSARIRWADQSQSDGQQLSHSENVGSGSFSYIFRVCTGSPTLVKSYIPLMCKTFLTCIDVHKVIYYDWNPSSKD